MAREVKAKKAYVSDADKDGKQSYFKGAQRLEFRFANGTTESIDPNALTPDIRTAAMFHGLSQKLGDAYASSKDVDEAYEKFMAMKEQVEAENWLAERESAGPRISQVILAIVAAKAAAGVEVTEAEVAEKYKAMDKDQQKSLMKDPRINAQYQRIKAEQAAARAEKAMAAAEGAEATEEFAI